MYFEEDERRTSYYCWITSNKPTGIIQIMNQNYGPVLFAGLKFHDYSFISSFKPSMEASQKLF